MLRVGLTGDLGSGKSTVAKMFAALGATVFSSDEMARDMMQPGEATYTHTVSRFGDAVVASDGSIDRRALARLAFQEGRVEELNAIIHPAVLLAQARQLDRLALAEPHAIAVVESALIFTAVHATMEDATAPWSKRFDRIVLVRAPLEQKIARFVGRLTAGRQTTEERAALEQDAHNRLALQSSTNDAHATECLLIDNDRGLDALRAQVDQIWLTLKQAEAATG